MTVNFHTPSGDQNAGREVKPWPNRIYARKAPDWICEPRLCHYSASAANETHLEEETYVPVSELERVEAERDRAEKFGAAVESKWGKQLRRADDVQSLYEALRGGVEAEVEVIRGLAAGGKARGDSEHGWPALADRLAALLDQKGEGGTHEGYELTPEECREIFALCLAHGMRPPEIHPTHPLVTGVDKLGLSQPHPEDGDPGRAVRLPTQPKDKGACETCGGTRRVRLHAIPPAYASGPCPDCSTGKQVEADPRLGFDLACQAHREGRQVKARLSLKRGTVIGYVTEIADTHLEIANRPPDFRSRYRILWAELDAFEILPGKQAEVGVGAGDDGEGVGKDAEAQTPGRQGAGAERTRGQGGSASHVRSTFGTGAPIRTPGPVRLPDSTTKPAAPSVDSSLTPDQLDQLREGAIQASARAMFEKQHPDLNWLDEDPAVRGLLMSAAAAGLAAAWDYASGHAFDLPADSSLNQGGGDAHDGGGTEGQTSLHRPHVARAAVDVGGGLETSDRERLAKIAARLTPIIEQAEWLAKFGDVHFLCKLAEAAPQSSHVEPISETGEFPDWLEGAIGLLRSSEEHDENCGIPHPADPDQSSRCTCGLDSRVQRAEDLLAEKFDALLSTQQPDIQGLEDEIEKRATDAEADAMLGNGLDLQTTARHEILREVGELVRERLSDSGGQG